MMSFYEAALTRLSIHKTGNRLLDEPLILSQQSTNIDDEILCNLLLQYFLHPFEKSNQFYRLYHPTGDRNLNEVFHFAKIIFHNPENFHDNSKLLATQLYDVTILPILSLGDL